MVNCFLLRGCPIVIETQDGLFGKVAFARFSQAEKRKMKGVVEVLIDTQLEMDLDPSVRQEVTDLEQGLRRLLEGKLFLRCQDSGEWERAA